MNEELQPRSDRHGRYAEQVLHAQFEGEQVSSTPPFNKYIAGDKYKTIGQELLSVQARVANARKVLDAKPNPMLASLMQEDRNRIQELSAEKAKLTQLFEENNTPLPSDIKLH